MTTTSDVPAVRQLIVTMTGMVGREMAMSIVVSRVSREARRRHGLEAAERMFQRIAEALPDGEHAEVLVADISFRMGPRESAVWDAAGVMIDSLSQIVGDERAFLTIFTCIGAPKSAIQGLIETMAEASQYDRNV